jgi:hypothetical protein
MRHSKSVPYGRANATANRRDGYSEIGAVLIAAALSTFIGGIYLASVGTIKYETTLMSFAVLVFMVGTTLITRRANIERRYIFYMWIAAFLIIGTLNGVSVIGTVVRP